MKKIVHVAQSAGGVAEYLYSFLKNFNDEVYEHIIIVSEDYRDQIERFKPYVAEIHIVPMTRDINLKSDIGAIFKLKKKLKIIKPDIVYLHSSKAGALGRMALLFNFSTKIIYNAHGWYFNAKINKKKKILFATIERLLAFKTNVIVNISESEYNSAIKYKIASSKKMVVIDNGIDFTKFDNQKQYREETRNRYNIKSEDIVIGVVGRLTEQKDPDTSIKAFNLLHKEQKNIKLMFVGSGDLEKKVVLYAKQNNLEKDIIITGWVNNVEEYIPAFDIAILPSKWEGFGLVIIEYMACDKPIVATDVGGISNIIKANENGYLIEIENENELKNKLKQIIETDDAIEIINRNKIYRKKYDIKNVIAKHKDIFDEWREEE